MAGVQALVDFYSGRGRDHRGRMLSDIRQFSSDELERVHDYIQWLFPLREPSPVNPSAPVLGDEVIAEFRKRPELRDELRRSFVLMADFYGFQVKPADDEVAVRMAPDFDARAANWITPGNHNFLRITRILKSLSALGEGKTAVAFLEALERSCAEYTDVIGDRTWHFWTNAVRGDS